MHVCGWAVSGWGWHWAPCPHPVTRNQGHSGKGWGRSNKGHPRAVSLSAGLSICVLVCRAAEQTPGESGAGRLSPVWSSDLAQWGQARKHPGSEVAGAGSPCAERCVLLGPKRSSRKATAWSCTLFTCLGQGQPLRPHLPLKNERRSRQRSSSSARKRRPEVPPARQSERCRPEPQPARRCRDRRARGSPPAGADARSPRQLEPALFLQNLAHCPIQIH